MIAIVAAVSENGIIGDKGKIPWKKKEDMIQFRKLTTGKVVVMGRKTFDSIVEVLGHPLKDRENIVISRSGKVSDPCLTKEKLKQLNVTIANSLEEVILNNLWRDIFIIGGAEIYKLGMRYADTMYLSIIQGNYTGDTSFPNIPEHQWKIVSEQRGENGDINYLTVKRTSPWMI